MLPLKLVRSLVLGETIHNPPRILLTRNHHTLRDDDNGDDEANDDAPASSQCQSHHRRRSRGRGRGRSRSRSKTPALLFLPTKEIITDTHRLATIARDLGMDLYSTPSLSHVIFSTPPSTPFASASSPSLSTPSSFPSTWSFSSSSASWSLTNDAVPIPFPSLTTAPLTHLRYFVNLSAATGVFKLVFFNSDRHPAEACDGDGNDSNWDCCSVSMYSRLTGDRIDTMEGFCRALAGKGWTFYKTKKNPSVEDPRGDRPVAGGTGTCVYLFRKVDVNRVRVGRTNGVGVGASHRVRELRLPQLDFRNAPLRILQYILLMTDDIFCLA